MTLRKFHDNSLNETNLGPLFAPNVPTAPTASIATLQGLYAQLKVWEECSTSSDPKIGSRYPANMDISAGLRPTDLWNISFGTPPFREADSHSSNPCLMHHYVSI